MIEFQVKNRDTGPNTFNMALASLRIVFMGTPEFAVASLDALVNAGYNIVAVVTAPDKPAGRGMKMNESAVKKYAVEKPLTSLQPEKLKNPEFVRTIKIIASRSANSRRLPHAAGNCLEHAAHGHCKSPWNVTCRNTAVRRPSIGR